MQMHYLFDKFNFMLLRSYFSVPSLKLRELGTAEKLSEAVKCHWYSVSGDIKTCNLEFICQLKLLFLFPLFIYIAIKV